MSRSVQEKSAQFGIVDVSEVGHVFAGFPVGFCLLTHGNRQYVAYYDQERRMTVAARDLDAPTWQYHVLPSPVGWDSHNYITMAIDSEGLLHLSGNMHSDPLIYFRTEQAGDIATFQRIKQMTGEEEVRCTYPKFMFDKQGRLIFHYRSGSSGNGDEIYNIYHPDSRTWTRLLDQPLTDGQGERNAYARGPVLGPDGRFHLHWVWRENPDCSTNRNLSYARSPDLLHWESAGGEPSDLPLTLEHETLWVDPIPVEGGIINGGHRLAFDRENRPVIAYHKSDADGNMQIYAARFEGGRWVLHQLTDWQAPIPFSGRGAMGFIGIRIIGFKRVAPDLFALNFRHRDYGRGQLCFEEDALQPSDRDFVVPPEFPETMEQVESDFPEMEIRRADDLGDSDQPQVRYLLQWETLPANHDKPRKGPLPAPSPLRLYKLTNQIPAIAYEGGRIK